MKVIDLLNKIANDEEVPKKILFPNKGLIYEYQHCYKTYYCEQTEKFLSDTTCAYCGDLNDEIEIIKEPKKIEKLSKNEINNVSNSSDLQAISGMQWENNLKFVYKLNEIIDIINIQNGAIK